MCFSKVDKTVADSTREPGIKAGSVQPISTMAPKKAKSQSVSKKTAPDKPAIAAAQAPQKDRAPPAAGSKRGRKELECADKDDANEFSMNSGSGDQGKFSIKRAAGSKELSDKTSRPSAFRTTKSDGPLEKAKSEIKPLTSAAAKSEKSVGRAKTAHGAAATAATASLTDASKPSSAASTAARSAGAAPLCVFILLYMRLRTTIHLASS